MNYLNFLADNSTKKDIKKFNQIKPTIKNDFFELDIFYSHIIASFNYQDSEGIHKHSFYELHIPLSGSAIYSVNGNTIKMTSDSVFIFTQTNIHALVKATKDYTALTLGFSFITPQHLSVLSELDKAYFQLESNDFLKDNIAHLLKLAQNEPTGYYYRINCLLTTILFNIFDNIEPLKREIRKASSQDTNLIVTDDSRIRMVITYINDNIDSSISVEDIATHVSISTRQLNRIIKANLNLTTNDLINELKIKAAKRYMADPTLSLSQIAFMCGFNSLTHFNLTFKKITDLTPKEFRNSELNQ